MTRDTVAETLDPPTTDNESSDRRSCLPRTFLVIGSSVCTGAGADCDTRGWAGMLAAEAKTRDIEYLNEGVGGTTASCWNAMLARNLPSDVLDKFGVVILSLSLGNEGLPYVSSPQEMEMVKQHYVAELLKAVRTLRSRMRAGHRLVIGGPYPNSEYKQAHLAVLQSVLGEIQSWQEVDHVIDFLQSAVHDGRGRWHRGASADPGHPNNTGHGQMLECIDRSAVFGQLWDV
eukprot:TRINITY_DN67968_c0_g1_i1.p1 TRINITY_DN67968_c0_g1~~TRINITY_DN67968_c0_g1_i1.p1  ORF type:complete len:231 (+),score=30.86 TRINITY_DN67968_c0_g1_i1:45-737(+)